MTDMSTYLITYGSGAIVGGKPEIHETVEVDYFCSYLCADLADLFERYPHGHDGHAGIRWDDEANIVSFGDAPGATSEVDYIVFCAGCETILNAEIIEDFETGRRTVEDGLREVIGWAVDRGFKVTDPNQNSLLEPFDDDDLDAVDALQWLFESAEQYLNDLDGYYFAQDGEAGVTWLWARDHLDPARVEVEA